MLPQDELAPLFAADISVLLDECGGLFDPFLNEWIFVNYHLAKQHDIVECIEAHESTHQAMFQSTTFGRWQQLLAGLSSSRQIAEKFPTVKELLHKSMELSWETHEGVATLQGILYQAFRKEGQSETERLIALLPKRYFRAAGHFQFILSSLPEQYQEELHSQGKYGQFMNGIHTAVAVFCLSTPHWDSVTGIESLSQSVLGESGLLDPKNSPDERLMAVCVSVQNDASEFWKVVFPFIAALNLPPSPVGNEVAVIGWRATPEVLTHLDAQDKCVYGIAKAIGAFFPSIPSRQYILLSDSKVYEVIQRVNSDLERRNIEWTVGYNDYKADRAKWRSMKGNIGSIQ